MVHQQRGVAVAVQRADRAEVLDQVVQSVGILHPHHGALVAKRTVGHPPAPVERADEVLHRHPHVGEEHLVEIQVVVMAHGRERPAHQALGLGGDEQHADALVLGHIRIGAHKGQQHVGVMRTGGPHLLPVDDELVAVPDGLRAQRRQIGTGARLTHPDRRRHLAAQDRHGPLLLLLVGAERQDRRRDDADTLRIEAVVDPPPRQFLTVHVLLEYRRVAATELAAGCPAAASRGRTAAPATAAPSSGMCEHDCGRSVVCASSGRCSSRKAENSARNCSTSASNVSCTAASTCFGTRVCLRE